MNKLIAGSSSSNQGGLIKNNLNSERRPNNNKSRTMQANKNLVKRFEEEEHAMPSPDTRAEIPSSLSRFGGGPGNGHHNGFDGNLSIWQVNEDISFLNDNMNNPLEL